jgi:hypothetical protein
MRELPAKPFLDVEVDLRSDTRVWRELPAATWQMQAGTDLFEAARYLGMTTRTLETVYGHHRPQHLSGTRDAYSRMNRQRFANDMREPKANKALRNTDKKPDSTQVSTVPYSCPTNHAIRTEVGLE